MIIGGGRQRERVPSARRSNQLPIACCPPRPQATSGRCSSRAPRATATTGTRPTSHTWAGLQGTTASALAAPALLPPAALSALSAATAAPLSTDPQPPLPRPSACTHLQAYQVLRRGGVPAANIITLMFDDVAHSPDNPHRGQLFNRPGGRDVYAGVAVDYRGPQVNAQNFLAVLAGDKVGPLGEGGRGKWIWLLGLGVLACGTGTRGGREEGWTYGEG